jgi:hypothetical protein
MHSSTSEKRFFMVNAIDLIGLQFQPFFKTSTGFSSTTTRYDSIMNNDTVAVCNNS